MNDTQVNDSAPRMPKLELKSLKSPKELLRLIFLEPHEDIDSIQRFKTSLYA